jgi:hypothetical protein
MAHGGAPAGREKEKLRAASASSTMDAAKMIAVGKIRTEKKRFRAKHAKNAKENQWRLNFFAAFAPLREIMGGMDG